MVLFEKFQLISSISRQIYRTFFHIPPIAAANPFSRLSQITPNYVQKPISLTKSPDLSEFSSPYSNSAQIGLGAYKAREPCKYPSDGRPCPICYQDRHSCVGGAPCLPWVKKDMKSNMMITRSSSSSAETKSVKPRTVTIQQLCSESLSENTSRSSYSSAESKSVTPRTVTIQQLCRESLSGSTPKVPDSLQACTLPSQTNSAENIEKLKLYDDICQQVSQELVKDAVFSKQLRKSSPLRNIPLEAKDPCKKDPCKKKKDPCKKKKDPCKKPAKKKSPCVKEDPCKKKC